MYSIGDRCVSAIEHGGEKIVHQLNQVGRQSFLFQRLPIGLRWDSDETDIATGRLSDLLDSISKRQRPWPRQFIKLA
ncbi:hypothetical protein D3C84_1069810 [compost metagenome]